MRHSILFTLVLAACSAAAERPAGVELPIVDAAGTDDLPEPAHSFVVTMERDGSLRFFDERVTLAGLSSAVTRFVRDVRRNPELDQDAPFVACIHADVEVPYLHFLWARYACCARGRLQYFAFGVRTAPGGPVRYVLSPDDAALEDDLLEVEGPDTEPKWGPDDGRWVASRDGPVREFPLAILSREERTELRGPRGHLTPCEVPQRVAYSVGTQRVEDLGAIRPVLAAVRREVDAREAARLVLWVKAGAKTPTGKVLGVFALAHEVSRHVWDYGTRLPTDVEQRLAYLPYPLKAYYQANDDDLRDQCEMYFRAVEVWRSVRGRYPSSLEALGIDLVDDRWSHAYVLVVAPDQSWCYVVSHGPDGLPDTVDDVRYP